MDAIARLTSPYLRAFALAVRADWPIYALSLFYILAGSAYLAAIDHSAFGMLNAYFKTWTVNFGILGPFFVAAIGVFHIGTRLKSRKRLAYRAMFAPSRVGRFLAGTLLLLTGMLVFTGMFSSIKTSLPDVGGFPFDVAQADIDKAIHFGVDPWIWLYAVAQHPWVLRVVEVNYNVIWFLLCYFTMYWVATSPRANKFRVRYLLTWMLSWIIIGNVIAGTWLSAGPAFYGFVTGDVERFGPQLEFLATTAGNFSSAHNFQAYLWHLYSTGNLGIGSGISAFPSMHVALVTINALFISEFSRRAGIAMWIYVGFVMLSSVYLGWHYAIDGYVSLVVVMAIYFGLKKLLPTLARLRWRTPVATPEASMARSL